MTILWRSALASLLLGLSISLYAEPVLESSLSVCGQAVLQLPPDQVTVSIGMISEAKQALSASQSMDKVISAIEILGVGKEHYRARDLNIQPLRSSRPRNADNSWCAHIIAYRVSDTLEPNTTTLRLSGDIIQQARVKAAHFHSVAATPPPVNPGDIDMRASALIEFWIGE